MFATQVLPQLSTGDDLEDENTSQIVGYIIVNDKKYEVKKGETKIGRDSSLCSIVVENFTLSKVHAVIESEGIDDSFIYDVGSTNQTKLGKKVLKPYCRYKLDNESKIVMGNVTAKFILPQDKTSALNLEIKESSSLYLSQLDELGNIFDVATQVTAPQPQPSKSIETLLVFEKNKDKIHTFKNPNSVLPDKNEKSPGLSKSVFNEVTQCRLDSQEKTTKAVYSNTSFESSGIFSLSTQFQLYEPSLTKVTECETKKSVYGDKHDKDEPDKIKSLLNDGQDDGLCTFMSLHSPKKQSDGLLNEVRTKTEVENLGQERVSAHLSAEITDCSEIESKSLKIRQLSENFSESSHKPTITSTPLHQRLKLNHQNNLSENSSCLHVEEDFIQTQEFKVDGLSLTRKCKSPSHNLDSLSRLEESQHYTVETLINSSTTRSENFDEDLILTQTFEALKQNSNEKTCAVIPERDDFNSDNDDLIQTQIYDVEKEKRDSVKKISVKLNSALLERPNKDVECHLNDAVDFTQKNHQEDFIATQVFEETTPARKKDADSKKNGNDDDDDDEDFISSQPVQQALIGPQSNRSFQEKPFEVETTSRESSPDLLGPGNNWKNSEDCIATQIFEVSECPKPDSTPVKISKQTTSNLSSHFETEKDDFNIPHNKVPDITDSSGDETESDLEILLDKNEFTRERKVGDSALNSFKFEQESEVRLSLTSENNSNSSYIFAVEPETHSQLNSPDNAANQPLVANLSDSDATDCEELAIGYPKIPMKQEPLKKMEIVDTQVLTLSLPNDFAERTPGSNDDWMVGKESPKFEIGNENSSMSPLSLEMPNTQEIETTMNRLCQSENEKKENYERPSKIKKLEVGINSSEENKTPKKFVPLQRQADSPLKRPPENNITDTVPPKKSKIETLDRFLKSSEKQFLKLVQAHDIGQIQPGRTRNSLKTFTAEGNSNKTDNCLGNNVTNERPNSRRKASSKRGITKKLNGDITSFLVKKVETRRSSYGVRKKETPPKEKKESRPVEGSFRILRSSRRNYENVAPPVLTESPTKNVRRSKRISRTKSGEYFSSPCVSVVFTGFDCESLDKVIYDLGGKKTNDLMCGEVVVADKIRRTVKFLCAIGLSLPITSPQWLLSCKKEKKFLNPWNFILKDEESEGMWDFDLKIALERSKKMKLLQGFYVFATKSTQPPVKDLLVIVECCGGTPLFNSPDVWPKNTIIVSCLEDKKWWPPPKRNIKIVHYECILTGVLKQRIDFKTYKLR